VTNSIMWFRRDLRLTDNHALVAAIADGGDGDGGVLPLFVVDDRLWKPAGANRRWFLAGCLRALDADLGGRLVVRHGDPSDVIPELAERHDVARVHRAQDVGIYGRDRDDAVATALAKDGRELVESDSPWAVPTGTLRTASGDAFKVYGAYLRAWRRHHLAALARRPSDVPTVDRVHSDRIPAPPQVSADLPEPGEAAAHRALDRFVASRLDDYAELRNDPGADATSRLSPYLKWGCLHPRQLLRRLDGRKAAHDTFAKELAWRDFYADVLDAWPESAWHSWNRPMADMRVDRGKRADERFEAWCAGRTGFPIVDAGLRQLVAEGWMHNRVRMITASFLVKDLHVDWTRGARYFLEHLVDGDLSSNNHGWQWVAGTGTDAAPYFRIFNPTTQGRKFDPDGAYVRRWVPELAALDGAAVHEPWAAPDGPPPGYPPPIVDHAEEREEALARYADVRR
jgi:deoxyribodipyrimidine photo-lyase